MRTKKRPLRLAITTGDIDGVGIEVSAKALIKLKSKKDIFYSLYVSKSIHPKMKRTLSRLRNEVSERKLDILWREDSPAHWVEDAAKNCLARQYNGLVTGPLSKETIQNSGMSDIGHTDILKRITSRNNIHMAFVGNKFNVFLATGHIPISRVSSTISETVLKDALVAANQFRVSLAPSRRKLPLALVGLNPHAGENGIIGQEELTFFTDALRFAKGAKIPVIGPLSPDAAFMKENWHKYSLYVSCYHDQGLIPFKMIHGQDDGVHVSVGLPFIRTSVDHGTAKDIFGKNRANPNSMIAAIKLAATFAQGEL